MGCFGKNSSIGVNIKSSSLNKFVLFSHLVPASVITHTIRPPSRRTSVPHSGQHRHYRTALSPTGQQAVASGDRVSVPTGSITDSWRAQSLFRVEKIGS